MWFFVFTIVVLLNILPLFTSCSDESWILPYEISNSLHWCSWQIRVYPPFATGPFGSNRRCIAKPERPWGDHYSKSPSWYGNQLGDTYVIVSLAEHGKFYSLSSRLPITFFTTYSQSLEKNFHDSKYLVILFRWSNRTRWGGQMRSDALTTLRPTPILVLTHEMLRPAERMIELDVNYSCTFIQLFEFKSPSLKLHCARETLCESCLLLHFNRETTQYVLKFIGHFVSSHAEGAGWY